MSKDNLNIRQVTQKIQRVPDRLRPRIKRHFQQQLVCTLTAQAVQAVQPFHAIADQHLCAELNQRSVFRQLMEQQPCSFLPTAQEGFDGLLVRVKMRRCTDRFHASRSCHLHLFQRGRKAIAPMVAAGKNMGMIVKRQVELHITALHTTQNRNTYIRICPHIYICKHTSRISYSGR